jgi:hypothetical protein
LAAIVVVPLLEHVLLAGGTVQLTALTPCPAMETVSDSPAPRGTPVFTMRLPTVIATGAMLDPEAVDGPIGGLP